MRKSAVSVRSGAGMPAHMARERNAGGGEETRGDVWKRKEGTDQSQGQCDPTYGHLGRHTREIKFPLKVKVQYISATSYLKAK